MQAMRECKRCGKELPAPSGRRGRPRVFCVGCSPTQRRHVFIPTECAECGGALPAHRTSKYVVCGHKCYLARHARKLREKRRRGMVDRACGYCGRPIGLELDPRVKYCNPMCRDLASKDRERADPKRYAHKLKMGREQSRKRYAENREEMKAKVREYRRSEWGREQSQRRYRKKVSTPEGRKALNEYQMAYYHEHMKDPKWREARNARQREYFRRRREAAKQ